MKLEIRLEIEQKESESNTSETEHLRNVAWRVETKFDYEWIGCAGFRLSTVTIFEFTEAFVHMYVGAGRTVHKDALHAGIVTGMSTSSGKQLFDLLFATCLVHISSGGGNVFSLLPFNGMQLKGGGLSERVVGRTGSLG